MMSLPAPWVKALAALAAISSLSSDPALAQDLSLAQTRALGASLLEAGDLASAQTVAEALLARDADDVPALILAARIAVDRRQLTRAVDIAARAYGVADVPDARFDAAWIAARANFELERYTRSQFWLRRARHFAPNDIEASAIAEDYDVARRLNPLSVDLRFGISPSSNINNGSQSETVTIFGLPETSDLSRDAQALSGLAFDLGGTARFRIAETETSVTTVDVSLDGTTYRLSNSSRDDLDAAADAREARGAGGDEEYAAVLRGVSGSDYSFGQLSFGLTHERVLRNGAAPTRFSARVGHNWYGGSDYTDFLDASVGQPVQLTDRSLVRVFAGVQKNFFERNFEDTLSLRFGGTYSYLLNRGDLLSVSLSNRINRSDKADRDYTSVSLGVDYALDQPFLGFALAFGAAFERRNFEFSDFAGVPRQDNTASLNVEAEIGQIEYYGFRPVAQLEVSQTNSDVALYDRQFVSFGFDLRSAF